MENIVLIGIEPGVLRWAQGLIVDVAQKLKRSLQANTVLLLGVVATQQFRFYSPNSRELAITRGGSRYTSWNWCCDNLCVQVKFELLRI